MKLYKKLSQKLRNNLALIIMLFPALASASQIKLAADGAEVVGKLSSTDVNRITLMGDRVKSVKGNKDGYEFTNDASSGDVYIRSLPSNPGGPLSLFLISEMGYTYKVLLTPMEIPSEQIFIKNPAISEEDQEAKTNKKEPLPYTQELIDLLKAMKDGEMLPGYKVNTTKKDSKKPTGIKVSLRASFIGPEYIGTIYDLKNTTKDVIQLDEKLFDMQGVRAIKFDRLLISPKEIVKLYIVSDRS